MAIRLDEKDKKRDPLVTISDLKQDLNELMTRARAFMTSHKYMKPKEKAMKLKELGKSFFQMKRDIEKFKAVPITNVATKFSFESFMQTYYSFMPRWHRFEGDLLGEIKDK